MSVSTPQLCGSFLLQYEHEERNRKGVELHGLDAEASTCCIGSYTFSVKPSIGETLLLPSTESEALSDGKELSTEVVAVAISRLSKLAAANAR